MSISTSENVSVILENMNINANNIEEKHNVNINVFRYNFDETVMDHLTLFAKLHQYDDRKTYKESWKLWAEENDELIKDEIKRLHGLGYEGDASDKMYKAARYYFRKKSNVKTEAKKRRKYITMDHELIQSMDNHIARNVGNDTYTPSSGYSEFCALYINLIRDEINRMVELELPTDDITIKFKKTYKNRYFIISRSINMNYTNDINDNVNIKQSMNDAVLDNNLNK